MSELRRKGRHQIKPANFALLPAGATVVMQARKEALDRLVKRLAAAAAAAGFEGIQIRARKVQQVKSF